MKAANVFVNLTFWFYVILVKLRKTTEFHKDPYTKYT